MLLMVKDYTTFEFRQQPVYTSRRFVVDNSVPLLLFYDFEFFVLLYSKMLGVYEIYQSISVSVNHPGILVGTSTNW